MLGERTGVERLTDESSEDSQNARCWRYDRIDTFGRFWCEWYSSGGINNKFNRSNGPLYDLMGIAGGRRRL